MELSRIASMRICHDRDADTRLMCEKIVAVIGFGRQGYAHARRC